MPGPNAPPPRTLYKPIPRTPARPFSELLDLAGNIRAPELIAAMSEAYGESERLTWEHIQEVSASLTGDQRRRYHAMVARCFGGECNMESKPATDK